MTISNYFDICGEAKEGNINKVFHLLWKGVAIESYDKNGNTLFMCLLTSRNITKKKKRNLVKEFISLGVNLNAANNQGDTILHVAVHSAVHGYLSKKSVRLMVEHGATTGILNKEGLKPRDIAYKGQEPNLGNFLLFSENLPLTYLPKPLKKCKQVSMFLLKRAILFCQPENKGPTSHKSFKQNTLSPSQNLDTSPSFEKQTPTSSPIENQWLPPEATKKQSSLPSTTEEQCGITSSSEKQNRIPSSSSDREQPSYPISEMQNHIPSSIESKNCIHPLSEKQNRVPLSSENQNNTLPSSKDQNCTPPPSEKQNLTSQSIEKQVSHSVSSNDKGLTSLECLDQDLDELECLICFFEFKPNDLIYKCCHCHKPFCTDCKGYEIMSNCPFCRRDISKSHCRDLDLEQKVKQTSANILCAWN